MDTLERSPSVLTEVPKPAVLCVGFPGTERSGMEHALGSIGLRAIWAGTYKQALSECAEQGSTPALFDADLQE